MTYIPAGYQAANPYIMNTELEKSVVFCERVFGAEAREKMFLKDGSLRHVELHLEGSVIMFGGVKTPQECMPGSIYLYVPDIDATHAQALEHGATELMPPEDQFYGDRSSGIRDPQGNFWWLASRVEEVPLEEMQRRMLEREEKQ